MEIFSLLGLLRSNPFWGPYFSLWGVVPKSLVCVCGGGGVVDIFWGFVRQMLLFWGEGGRNIFPFGSYGVLRLNFFGGRVAEIFSLLGS